MTLDAHRRHIEYTRFIAGDRTSVFDADPERVAIRDADGFADQSFAAIAINIDTVAVERS